MIMPNKIGKGFLMSFHYISFFFLEILMSWDFKSEENEWTTRIL